MEQDSTTLEVADEELVGAVGRILGYMAEVKPPHHTHVCVVCKDEFPCWDRDCPITESFVCDDCADDALQALEMSG